MSRSATLLTVSQTASMLGTALGAGRQWVDTLNDHRQGRRDLKGVTLMPFARAGGSASESPRPLYHPADVMTFIRAVRARYGLLKPFVVPLGIFLFHDFPVGSKVPWRMRAATPVPPKAAIFSSKGATGSL